MISFEKVLNERCQSTLGQEKKSIEEDEARNNEGSTWHVGHDSRSDGVYTKEKTLKKRETEIIYWLNTNVGEDWFRIRIFYEPSQKGWYIYIHDDENHCIGEIVSDTWSLCHIDADENTESEKT